MKESFWGAAIIVMGVTSLLFIFFFQTVTNTEQQNYNLLREVTEAAMIDAVDLAAYRASSTIRIDREKFVENFIRRFAEGVNFASTYDVYIYDVNEEPPKVTLAVVSNATKNLVNKDEKVEVNITNRLSAILETPY